VSGGVYAERVIAVSILGPVEVHREGICLPVPAGKTRELLVRLALDAGAMVRTERLIEDLWADQAVHTGRNTLQSKVSRLRRALVDPALIVGTAIGYTLAVEPGSVDTNVVLDLVEQAGACRVSGDPSGVVDACEKALARFGREVFPGGGERDWLVPHRVRFEAVRLQLIEWQLAARLELGDGVELVGELEELVVEHPLREGLWGLLMVALYRQGRQADALAAYNRVRTYLADELGLDPGPSLRSLERQVLLHDPRLDGPQAPQLLAAGGGNLPALSSPLVGRAAALAALDHRLGEHRLVTLVGPAGVGKTRLAIEAGRQAGRGEGVWLARLDTARDAASTVAAVADALGLERASEGAVAARLRDADLLLVLDNCEHLVEPVGDLADRLLGGSHALRILCTSQRPLGLDGETVLHLEPLPLEESVQLFTQRAGENSNTSTPDPSAVEDVCRALDGLPLAIELAAARTATLPISEIARRIEDRFTLLADPTGRRPPRQRTLATAIAWSYDLLFPDDQRGLWALASFAGGAPLAALERVLAALDVPTPAVLDVIARLADRSLVAVDHREDTTRYRLLDSIAAFSVDKARQAGGQARTQRAHAHWVAALADDVAQHVRSAEQPRCLAVTRLERANIDRALDWATTYDPPLGTRIANGFAWATFVGGDGPLGVRRLRRARLGADSSTPPVERATSLYLSAWLGAANDIDTAHADARAAIDIAMSIGDVHLDAVSRTALAFVLLQQGRMHETLAALDGTHARLRHLEQPWDERAAWSLTAHAALALSDLGLAHQACEQAAAAMVELDDDWALAHVENLRGVLAQSQCRHLDAARHLRRAADASHRMGFRAAEALHLANYGRALHRGCDQSAAIEALQQAAGLARSVGDLRIVAVAQTRLGRVLRHRGDRIAAKVELSAADHWFRSSGGGDGAALAACLTAAIDAETGDVNAIAALPVILDQARQLHDNETEILALDALARSHATTGNTAVALDLLTQADQLMPQAQHLLDEHERVDAHHARRLLGITLVPAPGPSG
jgi:predicted ATPase/DNA-binding SARP family transcriptional activator